MPCNKNVREQNVKIYIVELVEEEEALKTNKGLKRKMT